MQLQHYVSLGELIETFTHRIAQNDMSLESLWLICMDIHMLFFFHKFLCWLGYVIKNNLI